MNFVKRSNLDEWICQLEGWQTLTRTKLEDLQLKRLNLLLEKKSKVQDSYPEKLHSLDELSTLPFTTPQMLSASPGSYLITSQSQVSRVISGSTSGTMGPAKRVFYSREDTEHTITFFQAGISEMVSAGDRVLIDFPFSGSFGLGDLIEQAVLLIGGISIRPCLDRSFSSQCQYVKNMKPDCYIGSSVPLLSLLRSFSAIYPDIPCTIKRALISGDACPEGVCQQLEQLLGSPLFPHYGSRECGLGGAITCPAHEGMHLRENHILAEIIDDHGNPVPNGDFGELVLTTIGLTAMPLIRYRTGDYTRILSDPCPCGSVTKRLDRVSRLDALAQMQEKLDSLVFAHPAILDYQASIRNAKVLSVFVYATDPIFPSELAGYLRLSDFPTWMGYVLDLHVDTDWLNAKPCFRGKRFIEVSA